MLSFCPQEKEWHINSSHSANILSLSLSYHLFRCRRRCSLAPFLLYVSPSSRHPSRHVSHSSLRSFTAAAAISRRRRPRVLPPLELLSQTTERERGVPRSFFSLRSIFLPLLSAIFHEHEKTHSLTVVPSSTHTYTQGETEHVRGKATTRCENWQGISGSRAALISLSPSLSLSQEPSSISP